MVGTSKILTVSYGTFSCTLEGFDDSFNTMKAIAEYFRGLASDDRYFGAEPPTPDAEMLAKIAEREISRRVDASMDDSGIVLRAAALTDQSDAPSDADEATAEPEHDKESRAKVEAERKAAKAERKARRKAARNAKRDAEATAKAEADAEARKVADAKAKEDAGAKAADGETSKSAAKADAESEPDGTSDAFIPSSVGAATAARTEGNTGSEVEETRGDAPSSVLAVNDPAPAHSEVPAHPDPASVAAKLQRIRAVVGKSEDDETAATDHLTAPFLPQTETPDVADVQTQDTDMGDLVAELDAHEAEIDQEALAADETAQDSETPVESDSGSDMISRVMGSPSEDAPEEDAVKETAAPDVSSDDGQRTADVAAKAPKARVIRMKRAAFAAAVKKGEIKAPEASPPKNAEPDLGLLDGADELDEYLEDSDFAHATLSESETFDLDEDLAAIEADFAQESEAVDDVSDDAQMLDTISDAVNADEISTQALATDGAVQETTDAEDLAEVDAAQQDAPEKSAFLSEEPQIDDAALDRLMTESDVQMQEPEGSRRRDAIAQLKAAVAAKEAARQVGDTQDDAQDAENAFRDDLSQAVPTDSGGIVRPRPVVRSSNRTERPRPAPLKLVAAQRIDLDDSEKRETPVVPRRVAARADAAAPDQSAGSFAEFAENMGASELPDLLEAAAAYTAFVEGADEFSRPQILRRVRTVASDDFNREDGLRSFADLLRAGRFTKVRNGRFQVADDSRFNPERRAG